MVQIIDKLMIFILLGALIVPPIMLKKYQAKMSLAVKYMLSIIPVGYTFLSWKILGSSFVMDFFQCNGNIKQLSCIWNGWNFTPIVGQWFISMLACVFIGLPISSYWLVKIMGKQIKEFIDKKKMKTLKKFF